MSDSAHPLEKVKLNAVEACIAAPAVETAGKPILCKVLLTKGAWNLGTAVVSEISRHLTQI